MNYWFFAIFISIFLSIYGSSNYYIFARTVKLLPSGTAKSLLTVLFWVIAASFIVARFGERFLHGKIMEFLVFIGSFWLAYMLYIFLLIVFTDSIRLINHFWHIFPFIDILKTSDRAKWIYVISIFSLASSVIAAGIYNATHHVVREYTIVLRKNMPELDNLKVVAVSDVHLGTIIKSKRLMKIVESINILEPDIIIFAGDLVDEDIAPVIRDNMGSVLEKLRAKYGVFAVLGNHEYFGGADAATNYLERHGITMLRDRVAILPNIFNIVGREDKEKSRFSSAPRLSLDVLLEKCDKSLPTIIIDHQPTDIYSRVKYDFELSIFGHTHHGQLFPLNIITNRLYTISHGFRTIDGKNFYVSCGIGTWGPPLRTGSRPEIVVFNFVNNDTLK